MSLNDQIMSEDVDAESIGNDDFVDGAVVSLAGQHAVSQYATTLQTQ